MSTIEAWGRELGAQYAAPTIRAKISAVSGVSRLAGVDPVDLTREHVLEWLRLERSRWTRIKYLSHVRAWCAWAGIPDATEGIARPRVPAGIPRPVSEADLDAMIRAARPGREYSWIILGAYAGLRSAETAALRVGDLSSDTGSWLLTVHGKGGQLAQVPAVGAVVDVMMTAGAGLERGAGLWPGADSRAVQYAVRAVAARAGVECTSHQLRHRYGTTVYRGTRDLLLTQRAMRHTSPVSTAGYARTSDAALSDALAALPGADGRSGPLGGRRRFHVVR